ncbi:DNA polymerase III subunit gamma/tau [Ruminococcaceae bacterium OttesenSCG-928-A16]|nr:DNA polymerase III subunit gamma/tau [Ruminococcaceae bacterium OttesenSCG-928-A16]
MSEYRALYRKWRPKTFGDVVGQEAITAALSNQIIANKVGHAYLFTGTRGTGKTSCAKIFAKAVNCENRHGAEPCGECVPCLGLENGSILDVVEIDAASNNSVDDIRDLRDETAYRPSRCQYKVYIIDEVHMLSTSAFNALLKIMEEPPAHVIFILATTEIHKVPATILSRCQRYDFVRISAAHIAGRLQYVAGQEGIPLTPEAADLIARLADGALRDALSLLDTCAGLGEEVTEEVVRRMAGVTDKSYLFALSSAVAAGSVPQLLQLVASLREQSIEVKRLAEELVHHYRNYILLAAKPDGTLLEELPQPEREKYLATMAEVNEATAINAVRRLAAAMDKMGRSPDPRIELELALFDLCTPVQPAAQQPVAAVSQPQKAATPPAPAPVAQTTAPSPVVPLQPIAAPAQAPQPKAPAEEPAATAEPTEPPMPVATPEDGATTLFEHWPAVVAKMGEMDKMLHSYMKKSTAYFDGARVLIDGGDMFRSFVKEYAEANEKIKGAIQEVTGTRYAIGPYENTGLVAEQKPVVNAADTLKSWEAKGVPIKYD